MGHNNPIARQLYIATISISCDVIDTQERILINNLHIEFDEVDPEDIRGKYSHKIYGYLSPPYPGKEVCT